MFRALVLLVTAMVTLWKPRNGTETARLPRRKYTRKRGAAIAHSGRRRGRARFTPAGFGEHDARQHDVTIL